MTFDKPFYKILWICFGMVILGTFLGNAEEISSRTPQLAEIHGMAAEKEISDIKNLKAGLSAIYSYKFFRHIDQMPVYDSKSISEKSNLPILMLDHRFGAEDMIFDSGVSRGVGVQMNGLLKFSETGKYEMMALSNDGIRIEICNKMVLTDPDVHSERFTSSAVINIPSPGWYPIMIQYFQRKGTAAIQLQWKPPGKSEFSVIPAEAYAHMFRPENTP